MTANVTPLVEAPSFSRDPDGTVRYVLKHVGDLLSSLDWIAQGLHRRNPEAAARLRALHEAIAGLTIDSIREWPT